MDKINTATHHRTFTTDIYTHMEKQWVYTAKTVYGNGNGKPK
jgi:hypothetical protein